MDHHPRIWRFAMLLAVTLVLVPTAVQAGPAGKSCVFKITHYAFHPNKVQGGDHAKLVLRAMNCTDRTLDLTWVQYGEMIPPCPTVDPIGGNIEVAPHASYAPKPMKWIAPDCNGVEVIVIRFTNSDNGNVVAHQKATLQITTP